MAKRPAFSLIELLVVIALIGILVAVATVSYSTIQKRSRDSRRVTDLKTIQQGLEQYYTDTNSSYPSSPCSSAGVIYFPSGSLPANPKTGDPYPENCTTTGYCICAELEVTVGNAAANDCTGTTGTFYCIKNTQ
ncbi:MAG: hypothetical protein ACD_48C00158G0005 [uncultured bacterium]|nr:MAG: hypothetical protein ACD_48C00158G0005 [uncultured bacterium]